MSLNKAIVVGNLGRDPEMRYPAVRSERVESLSRNDGTIQGS